MSDCVKLVSLAAQIGAVDLARGVVGGGARAPARAAERDYYVEALDAALRTLRWVGAHEAEIRAAVSAKRAGDARASAEPPAASPDSAPLGEKSKACEFPLARRAAMRCAEGAFQKFLGVATPDDAAREMRRRCEVESCKDFDRDAAARERWRALDAEFAAWLRCVDWPDEGFEA